LILDTRRTRDSGNYHYTYSDPDANPNLQGVANKLGAVEGMLGCAGTDRSIHAWDSRKWTIRGRAMNVRGFHMCTHTCIHFWVADPPKNIFLFETRIFFSLRRWIMSSPPLHRQFAPTYRCCIFQVLRSEAQWLAFSRLDPSIYYVGGLDAQLVCGQLELTGGGTALVPMQTSTGDS